jgi:hypothetical protein
MQETKWEEKGEKMRLKKEMGGDVARKKTKRPVGNVYKAGK